MRQLFFHNTFTTIAAASVLTLGVVAHRPALGQSGSRATAPATAGSSSRSVVESFGDSVAPGTNYSLGDTPVGQPVVTEGSVVTGEPILQPGEVIVDETYVPVVAEPAPAPPANPAAKAHKGLFYKNNFDYLNDDYNGKRYFGDRLKNLNVGRKGKLDIGGEIRYRYHNEIGLGQQAGLTRFQGTNNDFGLVRLRLYGDYKVNDRIRFFAEGIYADVTDSNPEFIPRPIDRNFGDFLNLFADVRVSDNTTVRIGRQELLFGDQRFVSPLDFANTRRTFDGVSTFSSYEKWDINTFWTQPVPVLVDEFDRGDENVDFYGIYSTFKGFQRDNVDLFYLGLDNDIADFNVDTFGTRIWGNRADGKWAYETVGAIQTGSRDGGTIVNEAFNVTAGLGRNFDHKWKPSLWFFYDFASGDRDSTADRFEGFTDLFPLGHKYFGFIDAVQRTNVRSPSARLVFKPTKKLTVLLWYLYFDAAATESDLLSLGGTPAQDPTERDFGNEIDLLMTYNYSARTSIQAGYSHFFVGDKIIGGEDADFFLLQVQTRF